MHLSTSCKANVTSPSQEIPHILWYPQYHCCFQNSPPFFHIMTEINLVYALSKKFLNIHFNIILPSTAVSGLTNICHMPKMALGKTCLACSIHCYLIFYFFCLASVSVCDCVETVYELPSLPNNTIVKHFYTNREQCKVFIGCLSLERPPGGDWANTWGTKCFTVLFFNRK